MTYSTADLYKVQTDITELNGQQLIDLADQTVPLPEAATASGASVYRFYNAKVGIHFWTASEQEAASLRSKGGGYTYEGEVFKAATEGSSGQIDVYRLFHKETGRHFYTASADERNAILANNKSGYVNEGVAFKAYGSDFGPQDPVYRLFHTKTGTHFYTDSAAEKAALLLGQKDFKDEGIAFWVLP